MNMKKLNRISLINILNEYLSELEFKESLCRMQGDVLGRGILTLKINDVFEHINVLKNTEENNKKIFNSTPDNICWVLNDDKEKSILLLDLGGNVKSGRYLTVCGEELPNFIDNKKFDYIISNEIFLIDETKETINMDLTNEEVELIKKYRNDNK